jgi:hypothetical protein
MSLINEIRPDGINGVAVKNSMGGYIVAIIGSNDRIIDMMFFNEIQSAQDWIDMMCGIEMRVPWLFDFEE